MPSTQTTLFRPATVFAALALSAAVTLPAATARGDDMPSLEGYNEVRVAPGISTADSVLELIMPLAMGHPEMTEGRPTMDISMRLHGNTIVVDLAMGGYLDDSVSGEQYRAFIIMNSDGKWEMLDLGQRYICSRGANPGEPSTEPCS